MSYTKEQLAQYFDYISYPESEHPTNDPLNLLINLQAHQLFRTPFESTSLHYSTHRTLSLDHDDLFHKIVVRGRGGYCMELNAFFGAVLRGLGFNVTNVGGRVNVGERYTGWSHMLNIVTINGTRYQVDVGFGADGPTHPLPLTHAHTSVNTPSQEVLLEYRAFRQHSDSSQRLWVYSTREPGSSETSQWRERYAFTDLEFFPEDFAVMNLATMTLPTSYFVQTVLASLFVPDESSGRPAGAITLHKDEVKRRKTDGSSELVEKLETEADRVRALDKYFGIKLTASEQRAIRGWPTELKASS